MSYDWKTVVGIAAVAAVAAWVVMRTTAGNDVDPDEIDRDLAQLTQVLRQDQTIEVELMPPALHEVILPGTYEYRRVTQFWQPALAPAERRERRRRTMHD